MSEHKITVLSEDGEEKRLSAPAGALFLQLLKGNGYPLVCCSGKGGCGRCRIRFPDRDAPLPAPADRNVLTAQELRGGVRLACVHRVKRDCRIRVEFVHPKQVEVVTGYTGALPEEEQTDKEQEKGTEKSREGKSDDMRQEPCLLAMDLGTTTIAANLVSIASIRNFRRGFSETGKNREGAEIRVLAQAGRMNPQREWGSDVISRIQAAGRGEAASLRDTVREAAALLILEIMEKTGRMPEKICLAGNTVMEHLFLGLDVSGLGSYPFRPVSLEEQRFELPLPGKSASGSAASTESRSCTVQLLPGISAFVGADILAGLLACGFGEPEDTRCRLFIDLGTNGEMAIGNGKRLICTATAAGPAFEGGASANVPGTDMIAILARLLREEKIDRTGLLCEELFEQGWQEGELRVTQQDIRALQTAKAAVRTGVELLMKRLDVSCEDVEAVYLAGGFGRFLDVESAARIGLFPPDLAGKVRAVGNTSLLGAAVYGACPEAPALAQVLKEKAEVMNLAEEPGFYEKYLENLEF